MKGICNVQLRKFTARHQASESISFSASFFVVFGISEIYWFEERFFDQIDQSNPFKIHSTEYIYTQISLNAPCKARMNCINNAIWRQN